MPERSLPAAAGRACVGGFENRGCVSACGHCFARDGRTRRDPNPFRRTPANAHIKQPTIASLFACPFGSVFSIVIGLARTTAILAAIILGALVPQAHLLAWAIRWLVMAMLFLVFL